MLLAFFRLPLSLSSFFLHMLRLLRVSFLLLFTHLFVSSLDWFFLLHQNHSFRLSFFLLFSFFCIFSSFSFHSSNITFHIVLYFFIDPLIVIILFLLIIILLLTMPVRHFQIIIFPEVRVAISDSEWKIVKLSSNLSQVRYAPFRIDTLRKGTNPSLLPLTMGSGVVRLFRPDPPPHFCFSSLSRDPH